MLNLASMYGFLTLAPGFEWIGGYYATIAFAPATIRIGENELTTILVCRTYVKAPREYTLKDWDGEGWKAIRRKRPL